MATTEKHGSHNGFHDDLAIAHVALGIFILMNSLRIAAYNDLCLQFGDPRDSPSLWFSRFQISCYLLDCPG